MASHFFSHEGDAYVAGLFWQPVNGDARKEKPSFLGVGPETRKTAQRLDNCTHVAWRNADTPHIGFLDGIAPTTKEERNAGSAAFAIAEGLGQIHPGARSFLVAVEIPGASDSKWLLVAQHDRMILANGDMLGSEDEVLAHYHQMLSLPMNWDVLIAPDHWGIAGALSDNVSFEGLLQAARGVKGFKSLIRLTPIRRSRKTFVLAGVSLMSIVALMAGVNKGISIYDDYKRTQRLALNPQKELPPPPPPPWTRDPLAEDVLHACLSSMLELQIVVGNWLMDGIECIPSANGGTSRASFLRAADGWISHAQQASPDIVLSGNGETGSITQRLAPFDLSSAKTLKQTALPKGNDFDRQMRVFFQEIGIPIELKPARAAPGIPGRPDLPRPTWITIDWSIRGTMVTPNIILEPLLNPGMRIKKMSASLSNGSLLWSIEGTQYAN